MGVPPPDYQQLERQTASMGALLSSSAPSQLSHPVVIPQRRPKARVRGFVRAYAPDLQRCGIDQATFMAFIDGFNAAVAQNPIVGVIDLAGAAAGAVPASVFVGAPIIGLGIQVAAGVYTEVQARRGQNAYLTRMNNELFRPRGLYCFVMAYDINSRNRSGPRSLDNPSDPSQGSSQPQKSTRSNDGVLGATNFPATAQLVYPSIGGGPPAYYDDDDDSDDSSEESSGSQRSNGASGGGFKGFMAKFNEKRDLKSQVKFQKKNPTSLINPLLDPNAELTEKDLRKQHKRELKQERKSDKRERKAERKAHKHPDREPKQRKVKQGILYLMIVNMPTTEEMNTAHKLVGGAM